METTTANTCSRIADQDRRCIAGDERDCLLLALPDELLLAVLGALAHPEVAGRMAPVSRRLHALSSDTVLWQDLYMWRYGPPVHHHFVDYGKDWRWLYQARSQCGGGADSTSPGCVAIEATDRFYCGDLQQGVPHGYGLRVWIKGVDAATRADPRRAFALPGGARREGMWACGKGHGRTVGTFINGDRYEGECANDLRHGQGTYTQPGVFTYQGMYARGKRSGWGVMCHRSGRRYEGHWERGQRGGKGTLFMPDGQTHRGQWRSGAPCGWGVHTWPNGQRVEGTWNGGSAPCGQAVLIAADGRCFVDDAQEVFCVGGVAIPDGIDFGGRIKRIVGKGPTNDPAQPLTLDVLYLDGSRLSVGCPTADQSGSYRVAAHSGACVLAVMTGDKDKDAAGTCIACLVASRARICANPWYALID